MSPMQKITLPALLAIIVATSGCDENTEENQGPYSGSELKATMPQYLYISSEKIESRDYYAYYTTCSQYLIEEYSTKRINEGWADKGYTRSSGFAYISYYQRTLEKSLDRGNIRLTFECRERNSGDSGIIHMYNWY